MKFYEVATYGGEIIDCTFKKKEAVDKAKEINGTYTLVEVDVTAENMRRLIGNLGGYASKITHFK